MKKFILSIMFLAMACFMATAQSTSPRFGTLKNQDNTSRLLTNGYLTPVYAATVNIVPKWSSTTVKVGQLTGNLTLTSTVTACAVTDQLALILNSDATDRTVTFSTGFVNGSTVLVPASTTICLYLDFNGTGWVHATKPVNVNANGLVAYPGLIVNHYASAINATATVTAAQLAGGLLTSTSAAAVTMTLPTATQIATQIGAIQGTVFDFVVDNSAGANTVTVAVGAGITASGFPATNTLTLAQSATIGNAGFRLTFISATAATLTRMN